MARLFVLLWCVASLALARGEVPRAGSTGSFTASGHTVALDQPGGKREVFALEAGQSALVLKRGGPGGGWCKVQRDSGPSGWVVCPQEGSGGPDASGPQPREAGAAASPAFPRSPPAGSTSAGSAHGCPTRCQTAPLFPSPPPLTAADREVLGLCPARPDASVTREDARRFFAAHLSDPRLQSALSAAGRSGSREANLDWITDLWIGRGPRNAFTHVFCGDDWTREAIGGLHFLPRYAQLEAQGKLCYGGPVHGGNPLDHGQYLIRFRGVAPWSCADKPTGGFTEAHDPVALVAAGTRAFARCCPRTPSNRGGLYQGPELPGQTFQIWCGTRNGTYGIASFYPARGRPDCGVQ